MEKPTEVAAPERHFEELWQAIRSAEIAGPTVVVGLAYLFVLALYPLLSGYHSPIDFVHIGQYYCCRNRASNPPDLGYDGQFYYSIGVDPLHASVQMDNAPFRYQRILFSIVVWALALGGHPTLVAWWMLILNGVGTLAGTAALAALLKRHGLSPWFSLAFGLFFGQFASITHDVPDGLAAALVVFAALAIDRGRWIAAALWLAAAGLTRETTMIFATAFAVDALFQRRWGRAVLLLSSAIPLIIWLIVLHLIFGGTGLFFSSVVSKAPKIPLAGLAGIANVSPRFFITLMVIVLPGLLTLAWVAREVLIKRWRTSPGLLLALLITTIWLVLFLNTFTYGDLASSTRIVIGLPLGWLLYGVARGSRPLLWLATPWMLGVVLYALAVIVGLQSIIL
jgi:hypothetical protein